MPEVGILRDFSWEGQPNLSFFFSPKKTSPPTPSFPFFNFQGEKRNRDRIFTPPPLFFFPSLQISYFFFPFFFPLDGGLLPPPPPFPPFLPFSPRVGPGGQKLLFFFFTFFFFRLRLLSLPPFFFFFIYRSLKKKKKKKKKGEGNTFPPHLPPFPPSFFLGTWLPLFFFSPPTHLNLLFGKEVRGKEGHGWDGGFCHLPFPPHVDSYNLSPFFSFLFPVLVIWFVSPLFFFFAAIFLNYIFSLFFFSHPLFLWFLWQSGSSLFGGNKGNIWPPHSPLVRPFPHLSPFLFFKKRLQVKGRFSCFFFFLVYLLPPFFSPSFFFFFSTHSFHSLICSV